MKNSVCTYGVKMLELLEAINQEPAGIAFIVDEQGKLCGVFTDGDFRRKLLAGRGLNDTLKKEDLGPYVYANEGEKLEDLLKKTDRKVRIIPIVNSEGKPVDYFRYEHKTHFIPVAEPSLKGNEFNYLCDAFLSTWISSAGEYINRFEKDFANFCETNHGVAVSNGTVAIQLALAALHIGAGDEVIVPDLTFAATINTVILAGATPVIVDVDNDSWCIDPEHIRKAITPRTKAIIPVHVYGQPCDMDAIMEIALEHNLFVIEDAAEAHGARYKGKRVGSMGHISCFSFYGNKIITTGEGGMCMTASDEWNERMRTLRDHGMNKQKRYWHDEVGYNFRMTNLQAALGCAQLERIEELIEGKKSIESRYRDMLKDIPWITFQNEIPGREKVTWLVSVLVEQKRDELLAAMKAAGIDGRPFFCPLSAMPPYQKYKHSNLRATQLSARGINLPTVNEIDWQKIESFFTQYHAGQ